jgi:hypothetical protein
LNDFDQRRNGCVRHNTTPYSNASQGLYSESSNAATRRAGYARKSPAARHRDFAYVLTRTERQQSLHFSNADSAHPGKSASAALPFPRTVERRANSVSAFSRSESEIRFVPYRPKQRHSNSVHAFGRGVSRRRGKQTRDTGSSSPRPQGYTPTSGGDPVARSLAGVAPGPRDYSFRHPFLGPNPNQKPHPAYRGRKTYREGEEYNRQYPFHFQTSVAS